MAMHPLPPAPFLPDLGDVLQQATDEGFKQGLAEARMDEKEALVKVRHEREPSPEGLFVVSDDERKISTGAARTSLSSGPYAGLQSARKRVHESVDPEESPIFSFGPQKKKASKGSRLKQVKIICSRPTNQSPEFSNQISSNQQYSRGDLQTLKYLKTLITNVEKAATMGRDITQSLDRIRQRVQQMEFFPSLSPILVQKSGLLGQEGLPMVFKNHARSVDFPIDIRADAEILFRKWNSGQIDPHLLRGIVTKTGTTKAEKGSKFHSIDNDFAGRISCNYVGAGSLINGQWWPLQLCAKRDGAHGEIEKGIHGQKDNGAYSVVVSGGGYANVDNGNSLEYCGTRGIENSPSPGTSLMLKSYETQQPLRVLRSASLPATNAYRPARGIRYDGLYGIIGFEILDETTAMHRFSLSRLGGQDPIRCSGDGMIPSNAQILELNKVRDQIG